MRKKGLNLRSLTAFIVTWAFAVAVITGIVLYVVPHGRVANWVDWTLAALTKAQWANVHIITGAAFIFFGIVHLYFNWKPFKKYIAERAQGHVHVRKELVIASVFSVAFIVAAIADVPPVSWVFDLNEAAKDRWVTSPELEPPYGHAEETSLAGFSRRMGMDLDAVVRELGKRGVDVESPRRSLREIATASGRNPMELFALVAHLVPRPDASSVAATAFTPELIEERFSGTGVGRKTPAQLCSEIGFPAERARANLDRAGIAWSDEKLKAIAERAGVDPIDVLTAMLITDHALPQRSS